MLRMQWFEHTGLTTRYARQLLVCLSVLFCLLVCLSVLSVLSVCLPVCLSCVCLLVCLSVLSVLSVMPVLTVGRDSTSSFPSPPP